MKLQLIYVEKIFSGPGKRPRRARFGPQAVLWPPLIQSLMSNFGFDVTFFDLNAPTRHLDDKTKED